MGVLEDCERVVQESIKGLGGLDVIISNAVGNSEELVLILVSTNLMIVAI